MTNPKQARLAELAELERLRLRRQQTFNGPISYFGGQAFIESLDKEAADKRKEFLEENGMEFIKQKFPMTYSEFWPGI